ncbi:MAG: hypothetical protein HYS25_00905 [Ignavibacteriales bacterium]|nr:hypothetical protein [Ignavibacteriales bacterium]
MKDSNKILIAIVITALFTFFLTRECTSKYEVANTESDTTETTTTKITVRQNTFTAVHVGKIKKILADSLDAVYKNLLVKFQTPHLPNLGGEKQDRDLDVVQSDSIGSDSRYAYVSDMDTNFVTRDSSGFVIDSISVHTAVLSNKPLPEVVQLLVINHKSFNKKEETTIKINNKEIVERKKSFFERFKISPNVSFGVGAFTKTFDVYAGIGISYEL